MIVLKFPRFLLFGIWRSIEAIWRPCCEWSLALMETKLNASPTPPRPLLLNTSSGVLEGVDAARYAPNWASALTSSEAYVIPYRADGRTALLPTGLKTILRRVVARRRWLRPVFADDCDRLCRVCHLGIAFVNGLFDTRGDDPTGNRAKYPHLYIIYRSFIHYQPSVPCWEPMRRLGHACLCILGHCQRASY